MATTERTEPEGDRSAEGLFAEWAMGAESGDVQPIESLLGAHPEHKGELERLYADWKLFAPILGKVVPGLIASDAGLGPARLSRAGDDDDEAPSTELLDRLRIHTPNEGRYRFRAVIGRGGGGVVLKVWDSKLNRPLAMKVVLGRGEERPGGDTPRVGGRTLARFVDEARIASQLNHPGIVPVHELGADETGRAFFTMKLVRGEHLGVIFDHVKTGHDGWNQTRALGVLLRVCEAMSYAHDKGVIHRDLKPANVMVGRYGEVYVMDWGLARVVGESEPEDSQVARRGGHAASAAGAASLVDSIRAKDREATPRSPLQTLDGAVMGTPMYMAPEQARTEARVVDPRSDVYAVGALLYELITGQPPYLPPGTDLSAWAVYRLLLEGPPKDVSRLAPQAPAEVVAICEKAMAREAGDRYPTMEFLAADLRAFIEGRVVHAYETGAWAEAKKWVRRNKALAASLAGVILLLIAGTVVISITNVTIELERALSEARRLDAEASKAVALASEAVALAERDIADWRSLLATAHAEFPDDAEMRAMLLREAPESLRDQDSERRSIEAVVGEYHRVYALRGHVGGVRFASYSPDGLRILTTGNDNTARIWGAGLADETIILQGHSGDVTSAAWSPDGTRVVTASDDGTARVWNAKDGSELIVLAGTDAGECKVLFASWDSDGERILTVHDNGALYVWVMAATAESLFVGAHGDDVNSAAWSPDCRHIVTASSDGTARVWNADGIGDPIVLPHDGKVNTAAWSPDGRRIVTASVDRTARVWRADGLGELVLEGHDDAVSCASWSPDGRSVVTGSSDRAIALWGVTESSKVPSVFLRGHHTYGVYSVKFSPDGRQVVSIADDATALVWRMDAPLDRPTVLRGHTGRLWYASWSPDGSRIVTASSDKTARVWKWESAFAPIVLRSGEGFAGPAAWSPDGKLIVTSSESGALSVWQVNGAREPIVLGEVGGDVASVEWAPGGNRLLVASANRVRTWHVDTHEVVDLLDLEDGVTSAEWSPDGSRVAIACSKTAFVTNADGTGAPIVLGAPDGHEHDVEAAVWSPDGTRIVTLSGNAAYVWDSNDGAESAVLMGRQGMRIVHEGEGRKRTRIDSESGSVTLAGTVGESWTIGTIALRKRGGLIDPIAWSPDGSRILAIANDGTLRLWNANGTGEPIDLGGNEAWVESAAWSPSGDRIVAACDDGGARVWRADRSGEAIVLGGRADALRSAMWSPDGTRIVTVGGDGKARVWNANGAGEAIVLHGESGMRVTSDLNVVFGGKSVVYAAEWSPDGSRIVTTDSRALRVWTFEWNWPTLRTRLWETLDDVLSPDERMRYLGESPTEAEATHARQKAERDARVRARSN